MHQLPKFRDYNTLNGTEAKRIKWEFAEALEYGRVAVGINQSLTDEIRGFLWNFCCDNFKDFSPQEVKKSFDYFVLNKITESKLSHYNALSSAYLANILQEYRKFRRSEISKKIKENEPKEKEATKEEKHKIRKEYCKILRQKVQLYLEKNEWKIDLFEGFKTLNDVSRLGCIDWSNYLTDGKVNDKIQKQAENEIKQEIQKLKNEFEKRKEFKLLSEQLDLHLSGSHIEKIEAKKRHYISKIILQDWISFDEKQVKDFFDKFENEYE